MVATKLLELQKFVDMCMHRTGKYPEILFIEIEEWDSIREDLYCIQMFNGIPIKFMRERNA